MKENNEKLIEDTEKRLQFATTLALFFPVLVEALQGLSDASTPKISENVLVSAGATFFFILSYLFFELRKYKFSRIQLQILSSLFMGSIVCFGMITFFFALLANGNITSLSLLTRLTYGSAVYGIIGFPTIATIIGVFNFLKALFTFRW